LAHQRTDNNLYIYYKKEICSNIFIIKLSSGTLGFY